MCDETRIECAAVAIWDAFDFARMYDQWVPWTYLPEMTRAMLREQAAAVMAVIDPVERDAPAGE